MHYRRRILVAETKFKNPISEHIYKDKYKAADDKNINDTWNRVARALSNNEPKDKDKWFKQFKWALQDFKVLPGGRILANAGVKSKHTSTLVNCFVSPEIPDSMEGIMDAANNAANTLKSGGGIGFDFSQIRPAYSAVGGINQGYASGPVSFMSIFDKVCEVVMAGNRRGAMIGVLRIDHPDIEMFIKAKEGDGRLENMNLSIAITDEFMEAVQQDDDFDLKFDGEVSKTVKAKDLFDTIVRHTYDYSEPGVIFIDTVNKMNNLYYEEKIAASNPCGEQMLGPGGSCNLVSVNLTKIISNPFSPEAAVDFDILDKIARLAVRMGDNVVDVSNYPLPVYEESSQQTRRVGLGITGLANALAMLSIPYNTSQAIDVAESIMKSIKESAYDESAELAAEKGAFPLYSPKFLKSNFFKTLPKDLQDKICEHGIRNSHLLSIQPTGTVSLLANNISSGLEPIFALSYTRKVKTSGQDDIEFDLRDYAYHQANKYWPKAKIERVFKTVNDLTVTDHIDMQAALQKHVDSSISKTVNVANSYRFEDFKKVYLDAWKKGLKGITTFRPTERLQGIITDGTVYDSEPKLVLDRGHVLPGKTYKIKDPKHSHSYYVTINDIADPGNGTRPWEIFFNSKSEENDQFVKALSVLLSEVFKRVDDPTFVAESMKMISDSGGGFYEGGKFYRSLIARIGQTIVDHTGKDIEEPEEQQDDLLYGFCPKCQQKALTKKEGCEDCYECGYSRCN